MRKLTHTNAQVSAMLSNPVIWMEKLRNAAGERGFPGAISVAPFAEIASFLTELLRETTADHE